MLHTNRYSFKKERMSDNYQTFFPTLKNPINLRENYNYNNKKQ